MMVDALRNADESRLTKAINWRSCIYVYRIAGLDYM